MRKHLTHTGPYAGTPFCGAIRQPGEENSHIPYGSIEKQKSFVERFISCEECKKIFKEDWL